MGKNIFNSIQMTRPKSNVFDLSHDVKLSCDMGELVPTMCVEAVPGDKFSIGCDSLLRFAPMLAPIMHRVDVSMHYFFVPNRLLWPNWENYITQTKVAGVIPPFPFVTMDTPSGSYGPLADYLGVPTPIGVQAEDVNALPFAAYQMVYNEYYRDQNLQNKLTVQLTDGDNNANADLFPLRNRCWEHDYFTAALPFAQKGDSVSIPIGTINVDHTSPTAWEVLDVPTGSLQLNVSALGTDAQGDMISQDGVKPEVYLDPKDNLSVDPTTINDLRRAFRLQEWLEKAARAGSRYIESILGHFGVRSSDKRLNRPEYITGTKSPVIISEVLQTSETVSTPQGSMAGHGVSVTQGKYGGYFCEEHGYIIGIMSVMPKTAYQQGMPKHFLKTVDAFQFFWPEFANIGEQEVLNKEVYAFQGATGDNTFGYVPRYAEYKFEQNRVAGDFRSSLAHWHMGRIFSAPPNLNAAFVESDPTDRIFAVTGPTDSLWAHVYHKVRAVRSMPKFGTPQF